MTEELISSLYPPPPAYYKFFTQQNLNKLEEWRYKTGAGEEKTKEDGETSSGDQENDAERVEDVPSGELKFLVPPKQPEGDHYRGYGNIWSFEDKLPSLKDSGWKQLYQEDNDLVTSKTKIDELHKLMDSLLLNFLELVSSMSIDPSKFHYKIEDLKLVLININHILNTYRPHQTRESLIMLIKKQIEKKNLEISEIDTACSDIKAKILNLIDNKQAEIEESTGPDVDKDTRVYNEVVEKLLSQI